MTSIDNPFRGSGIARNTLADAPYPSVDVATPRALLARCPKAAQTPLVQARPGLWVKDERTRMELGSFKALGAAYVIARDGEAAKGRRYVTASAGNHGLSVAAGVQVFGAKAVIYIAETVPESFAERLRETGAEVRREGAIYEDGMAAAMKAAEAENMVLLSDSSWPGYFDLPYRVMEGYLVMAAEAVEQMQAPATHVFLQAGVGGLAGAVAAYIRNVWGDGPKIIVVEPSEAPALQASITAGRSVIAKGGVSDMGRLDCKEPSLIALAGLSRDADAFVTLTDAQVAAQLPVLADMGLATSSSGGAGIAAALIASDLGPEANVLTFLSEGAQS